MNHQRIAQLKALMATDKSDPFLPYAVAQEYMAAENWTEAAAQFAEVTSNFPEYLPSYYHHGLALVKLGNIAAALEVLSIGFQLAKKQKDGKTAAEIEALIEDLE
ncbi:MAG: tetratricopeptide repeat protein [Bacteroidetes bacterium]|nr:tetratricopeptide repeat protein [Bacteroidota bacterium]MBL0014873.1 tetratricopeptide repeat protein [Bacteroidota bacterium]MBP6640413.1 tetratricopeptide repeat protein [Bacteroidia bacterium]MBP6721878.1 tetratricopeptide repeat protein [Bacteroidia bacterium]